MAKKADKKVNNNGSDTVDKVTVINPLRPGTNTEHPFVIHNQHFSQMYSMRDLEASFGPQQARRNNFV